MSLDVTLTMPEPIEKKIGSGIFVRLGGATVEISPEEWAARFPGREPVRVLHEEDTVTTREVYSRNITHNLNIMAEAAGLYKPLWRPDEIGVTTARQLIPALALGLSHLKEEPDKYRAFNPENGWGDYNGLVDFVASYLDACINYPKAEVSVSR